MHANFSTVRERYLDELIEHGWYDVRTFSKKQRRELKTPGYLRELFETTQVTAVEMHSHTPCSDGLIEPERIQSWTNALYKKGYFRHEHLSVPLVVMITDHDYIYESGALGTLQHDDDLLFLSGTEVSTKDGHVLYYGSHPEVVDTYELDRPQLSVQPLGMEFLEMVKSLDAGIAFPSHPYRETSMLHELPGDEVAPLLPTLEILNGKTPADQNLKAVEFAKKYGIRGVGGSDAHQMSRLYSYLTIFDGPIRSMDDLLQALRDGDYFPVHGEHLRFKDD
jgi:predicted metal-dependent phosphoesterase TrpH